MGALPSPVARRIPFAAGKTCFMMALILALLATPCRADAQSAASQPAGGVERIAFSSNRSGQWRIWAMNPDGSQLRRLSDAGEDEADVGPAISPDGAAILFASTRGKKPGVWCLGIDKPAEARRICDGDQGEWCPDGKRIVLRRGDNLVVRAMDGEAAEKVLLRAEWLKDGHASGPAWSPDGKTIAFACRWAGPNGLYTVTADGGTPAKVFDKQPACAPHWSPDGLRLVYETETNICTINPDGTKNRTVTHFGGVQRYGRFTPDGKTLVFCQAPAPTGPWELYTIPANGGTPAKLSPKDDAALPEGASDMYPDWR
jgi:Tol biopolymer transport system component